MKHLGFIYVDSIQSVSIASIQHDDKQTEEFKLQDEFSAQGYWFKSIEEIINNIKDVDFIRQHTERLNGKVIVVCLHSDTRLRLLPPKIYNINYKPF